MTRKTSVLLSDHWIEHAGCDQQRRVTASIDSPDREPALYLSITVQFVNDGLFQAYVRIVPLGIHS